MKLEVKLTAEWFVEHEFDASPDVIEAVRQDMEKDLYKFFKQNIDKQCEGLTVKMIMKKCE